MDDSMKLLDQKALAGAFGVTRQTIANWLAKGVLPAPAVNQGYKKYWTLSQIKELSSDVKNGQ